MSSAAKQAILNRIRDVLGSPAPPDPNYRASIPSRYIRQGTLAPEQRLALFVDRLDEYGAQVRHCTETGIASAVAEALGEVRAEQSILVPQAVPDEWLPAGFLFLRDTGLSHEEIDRSAGVLTGCALAVAFTGTIVLRHSAAQGRRALTLIPDRHVCVIFEHQIVQTVPEAIAQMKSFSTDPITTISGPSATSDIEMTRIKGVHGPRFLSVILVRR